MFTPDTKKSELLALQEIVSYMGGYTRQEFFDALSAINYLLFKDDAIIHSYSKEFTLRLSVVPKSLVKSLTPKLTDQNVIDILLSESALKGIHYLSNVEISDAVEEYFAHYGWDIQWILERPNMYHDQYSYNMFFIASDDSSWQDKYEDVIKSSKVLKIVKPCPNKRLSTWKENNEIDFLEDHGDYSFVQVAEQKETVKETVDEENIYDLEI